MLSNNAFVPSNWLSRSFPGQCPAHYGRLFRDHRQVRACGRVGLTALLLMAGCSSLPALPAVQVSAVPGGQVAEAVVGTTGPLNPLFEQEDNAQDIDSLVYQGLTRVDGNEQVVGLLASNWQISEDKTGYTFNLRTNDLRAEKIPNPRSGTEHHFKAYRLKSQALKLPGRAKTLIFWLLTISFSSSNM